MGYNKYHTDLMIASKYGLLKEEQDSWSGGSFCILDPPVITCYTPVDPDLLLGQMQVHPRGEHLAMNLYNSEDHRMIEFPLDPNNGRPLPSNTTEKVVASESANAGVAPLSERLDRNVESLDYVDGSGELYYLRDEPRTIKYLPIGLGNFNVIGIIVPQKKLYHLNEVTSSGSITEVDGPFYTEKEGEVRRGADGRAYLNQYLDYSFGTYDPTQLWTYDASGGSFTWSSPQKGLEDLQVPSGRSNMGLPLQPWRKEGVELEMASVKREVGDKRYELTDHLGNVRATFSDLRLSDLDASGEVSNTELDVVSVMDYYASGMMMPGRKSSPDKSRYAFQGMEQDEEMKDAPGNHYTTEFRQYDPRLGRWFSVDPKVKDHESPYALNANSPMWVVDPLGTDSFKVNPDGGIEKFGGESEKDYLFASDYGGEINENIDPLVLENTSILPSLMNPESYSEEGDLTYASTVKGAGNAEEIYKAFVFLSKNTNVEWGLYRTQKSEAAENKYVLGSKRKTSGAPTHIDVGLELENIQSFIHSHPSTTSGKKDAEKESMVDDVYFDDQNYVQKVTAESTGNPFGPQPYFYYTFFPVSGNVWHVSNSKDPNFIRNIEGDANRLFFGTLRSGIKSDMTITKEVSITPRK